MTSIREFGMMAGMARDKIGTSLTDGLAGVLIACVSRSSIISR
jgi:hypothetical protein